MFCCFKHFFFFYTICSCTVVLMNGSNVDLILIGKILNSMEFSFIYLSSVRIFNKKKLINILIFQLFFLFLYTNYIIYKKCCFGLIIKTCMSITFVPVCPILSKSLLLLYKE